MIPKDKWKQYGLPDAEIKGIVVHNTNNQSWSAERLEKWLSEECTTSQGCHFLVDHKEVRQVMPLDWSVFSTGHGYDFGNLHCIAIEIVSNPSNTLYLKGQERAIELIKSLIQRLNSILSIVTSSAAALGVGARKSATKSKILKSVS